MAFDPLKHTIVLGNKQYLPVNWRIVWFKETYGTNGAIITELMSRHDEPPLVKATILVNGSVIATAYGGAKIKPGATVVWSGREIEKAETAAVGRALRHAGFGGEPRELPTVDVQQARKDLGGGGGRRMVQPSAPVSPTQVINADFDTPVEQPTLIDDGMPNEKALGKLAQELIAWASTTHKLGHDDVTLILNTESVKDYLISHSIGDAKTVVSQYMKRQKATA